MASVLTTLAVLAGFLAGAVQRAEALGNLFVAVGEGRVTVKAADARLDRVLHEVAAHSSVVVSRSGVPFDNRVSVHIDALEIEAALRRLLIGYDYVLLDSEVTVPGSTARARLSEVRIVGSRVGNCLRRPGSCREVDGSRLRSADKRDDRRRSP